MDILRILRILTMFYLNGSNVLSMARMTQMVLPKMIRRSRGVIINIGSLSGAFSSKKKSLQKFILFQFLISINNYSTSGYGICCHKSTYAPWCVMLFSNGFKNKTFFCCQFFSGICRQIFPWSNSWTCQYWSCSSSIHK